MTITFPKYIDIRHVIYVQAALLLLRIVLIIDYLINYFKKEEEVPIGYESANPSERENSNT